MALTAPPGFDSNYLREQVRLTYQRVADTPRGAFHFHRGPEYAIEYLGYDADALARVPGISSERFAGVGNPHQVGRIFAGETVLDHACGSGTDVLLAAQQVGPEGRAIGVDMTAGMRRCATLGAQEAGLESVVDIRAGYYEALPVEDASVDVVISNGVVNLAPDKHQVFAEVARVLRPGGRLHLADVAVARELKPEARENPDLWAACIGGALQEHELILLARTVGLRGVAVTARFDCFRNTSAENKVSKDLSVHGVNLIARKEC